ncbi:GDSL-type esterase/lipase family protein [Butyrivibrio sp. VCD2006]|uniref:GDSL-type esterase/lipase family protein n=1 Tax=Butyrivibrio sp. VCD2006 TaxID=1280664 RepID=UPI0004170BDE|nr:GDSL-type esterase/lipase family protein [Butyrivibrio sp. VCD2006]
MKQVLAFGDSNTWGLIPGTTPYERYPWGVRWTSILQEKRKDVRVIEEGLCGRTTIFEDELRPGRKGINSLSVLLESHYPIDSAIIMLGTNDCKSFYNVSANTIGKGIEKCLDVLEEYVKPENILLISPINLGADVWKPEKDPEFDKRSVETSKKLKDVYKRIADKKGVKFLAASDYVDPSDIDNEHMDVNSHRVFADVVNDNLNI